MDRLAKPLGRIFQPEIAAEAIYRASIEPRREVWVGYPAVHAILGTRLAPALLDRWLAFRAYEGQQSDEPLPDGYRDNLFGPVADDRGAHGRFDDRAKSVSIQVMLNAHRHMLGIIALLSIVALGMWMASA